MRTKRQLQTLWTQLSQYPSRTLGLFKTTYLPRILRKHIQETDADRYHKEFTTEQWIRSLFQMQIQKFTAIRPFVDQLGQNRQWQLVCGLNGNVPTQGQYSRRLVDPKLEEILVRTFQTYQKLIPQSQKRFGFTPKPLHFELIQQGYRPFRIDCTSLALSIDRYLYAKCGYVPSEKKTLPSTRIHTMMDGITGTITKFLPTEGNKHESPIADQLLGNLSDIEAWLSEFKAYAPLRPFFVFDRGYWKQKRFMELDHQNYGWSIPWKRRTLVGAQLELLNFPADPGEPLEMLVWKKGYDRPWRRIIGQAIAANPHVWDVLTNDWTLKALTVLALQKDRWDIEEFFKWFKKQTAVKQPLGTFWESFVIHCLLLMILQVILIFFLLLGGFHRWQDFITRLLRDLRHSDAEEWTYASFIPPERGRHGGGP